MMDMSILREVWQTLGGPLTAVAVGGYCLHRLRRHGRAQMSFEQYLRGLIQDHAHAEPRARIRVGVMYQAIDHDELPWRHASELNLQQNARFLSTIGTKTVMPTAVTTRSGSNARHGTYLNETKLTATAVAKRGVRRVTTIQSGPDLRGAEAQPLYLPNVRAKGREMDLVIICTMGNVIHAYDLRSMQYVWEFTLGNPIKGSMAIDFHMVNDTWGILSTPVIDAQRDTMYLVMWSSPDGTMPRGKFEMLEVDLSDGTVLRRTDLTGVTYDPGNGLQVQHFGAMQRKQRCSLLYLNGIVYAAFGTIAETASGARGWIIAVDATTMRVTGALTTTVRGDGGGIWMAGQGLSSDAAGNIYCTTGNGDFDGVTDFGECFLKIGWFGNGLRVLDWWAAFSDDLRTGRVLRDPSRKVGLDTAIAHTVAEAPDDDMNMPGMEMPMPTNKRTYDLRMTPSGAIAMGAAADMDLGSGGAQPIDKHDLVIGAGKDGISYLVRKSNMGRSTPSDLRAGKANYAKLAGAPMFFTYAAPGHDPAPNDIRDLNYLFDGKTHHMHSTPVYHEGNVNGDVVFCWGENSPLKAYKIVDVATADGHSAVSGKALQWIADGREWASPDCRAAPGGMPGGMMCLSANGTKDAVLWATVPAGDGNMTVTQGRLLAYDANDMTNGVIRKLWDSWDWNLPFVYNKFCPPTIADGHVLVANYSGGVDVYALA